MTASLRRTVAAALAAVVIAFVLFVAASQVVGRTMIFGGDGGEPRIQTVRR